MEKEILIEKGRSAALFTIPLRAISQLISILISIVLIRILSKNDFGIYSLLYSSIAIITMISSFGLSNVLQRYLPEYYARSDFSRARKLFHTILTVRFIASVTILFIVIIFWKKLASFFQLEHYQNYFLLFFPIIIFHQQWHLINICLGSAYLHKFHQFFGIIFSIIKITGYSVAYFLEISLINIILTDLCAYSVLIACLFHVYLKHFPRAESKSSFNKNEKKRIFRYGAFYNFNDVGVKILGYDIDNFIIAFFMDPFAVGAYAFCNRASTIVIRALPLTFFQDILRPLFFGLGHNASFEKIKTCFILLIKCQYLIAIPAFFIIHLFSFEFIEIFFGSKYVNYSNIFLIVLGFKLLGSFQLPVGFLAQLHERAGIVLFSKIFLAYNLALAFFLIPYFGIIGAAVATGTANILKNFLIWWFVRKSTGVMKIALFFIKSIIFWSFTSLIIYQLKEWMELPIGIFLLLVPFFFLIYLKLDLFDINEIDLIMKALYPYRHKYFIRFINFHGRV